MGEYVRVARAEDIPPGTMATFPGIDLVDVCVINLAGSYFAVSNVCTHKGAPLNRGTVKGEYLVCPWHKASFRIKDGKYNWPAARSIRSFKVKVEGGQLYVEKPAKPS